MNPLRRSPSDGPHPLPAPAGRLSGEEGLSRGGSGRPLAGCPRLAVAAARSLAVALALLLGPCPVERQFAQAPIAEHLFYSITWPSGLAFGRAELRSRFTDPGWRFESSLRASLPGTEIDGTFVSRTDDSTCSSEFEKHLLRGTRRTHEHLRFSPGSVTRTNLESSDGQPPGVMPTGTCARDALSLLYHLRHDLAMGRIPSSAEAFFGARYQLRLEHSQTRRLVLDGERHVVDEVRMSLQGPAASHTVVVSFGRDAARTPLLFELEWEDTIYRMQIQQD